jgi:hypothetical protein
MNEPHKTVVAKYKGKRVRAYLRGDYVLIDQQDIDFIMGNPNPKHDFLNPDLDKAISDVKRKNPEFAVFLLEEFGQLTPPDHSAIDFSRRD